MYCLFPFLFVFVCSVIDKIRSKFPQKYKIKWERIRHIENWFRFFSFRPIPWTWGTWLIHTKFKTSNDKKQNKTKIWYAYSRNGERENEMRKTDRRAQIVATRSTDKLSKHELNVPGNRNHQQPNKKNWTKGKWQEESYIGVYTLWSNWHVYSTIFIYNVSNKQRKGEKRVEWENDTLFEMPNHQGWWS